MFENMSQCYQDEVAALREWYKERLPVCGKLELSEADYRSGTDSLTGNHKTLAQAAFVEWLAIHNYELSYNQCCSAFFAAMNDLNLLTVTSTAAV